MKLTTILIAGVLTLTPARAQTPADLVNRAEPDWWLTPRRLIQTNLREIDAGMDVGAYVASLKAAGANVVLFNVGGTVANYPTDLPYQYRNPFMKGDLTGEAVNRLHAEGIRMIAQFDFSKVNERIAQQHPEWLTRDADGRSVPAYNGQVATCLNGWYQQEGMLKVLGEAIDCYPIDGVFFNMIGYPRRDYSGRAIGICQWENCRQRFHKMLGHELPKDEQATGPVAEKYKDVPPTHHHRAIRESELRAPKSGCSTRKARASSRIQPTAYLPCYSTS